MSTFGAFKYDANLRSAVKGARAKAAALPNANGNKLLNNLAASNHFHRSMEVAVREDAFGQITYVATSKLETILNNRDKVSLSASVSKPQRTTTGKKVAFAQGRKVEFYLEALLLDADLQKKFCLSKGFMGQVRSLAVEDAVEAAKVLEERITAFEDYKRATVNPGQYGYTWKTARESLKHYASSFPLVTLNTEALFCGDKIFIYSEKPGEKWRVFGSERIAWLVRLVHRIVSATSPDEVNFYLNKELSLLDINIATGDAPLRNSRAHHAANHADLRQGKLLSEFPTLSTNDRIRMCEFTKNLQLVASDAFACATAVRVSNRHIITCEHVLEESQSLRIGGLDASDRFSLADDLLVVRSAGKYVPWHLREPNIDEMVLLCYCRFTDVEYAGPFRITDLSPSTLNYTINPEIQAGMSGAAIIALSDLAFLGVHAGSSDRSAFGLRYSVDVSSKMWMIDDDLSVVDTAHIASQNPIQLMRKRGLGPNCKVCAQALTPVVDRTEHISNALIIRPGLCVAPRHVKGFLPHDPERQINESDGDVKGLNYFSTAITHNQAPLSFREPIYGEHVILMGKAISGDTYATNLDVKITQTYKGNSFQIAGIDYANSEVLLGCAVLAVSDGAILGLVTDTASEGAVNVNTAECSSIDGGLKETYVAPMKALSNAFPNLNVSAWFSDACEELKGTGQETRDDICDLSRELLAMSSVRKTLYSRGKMRHKIAVDQSKFYDDIILYRAVVQIDRDKTLMSLRPLWKLEGEEQEAYVSLLLFLIYFVDKFERSIKIVEIVEHLALI